MSLQMREISSVKISFDKEKTKDYHTDFSTPCDCQDCRNYYKNVKYNLELIDFLADFGVDYLRAEEIMPIDLGNEKDSLINYRAYYSVVGSISDEVFLKKENYSISFDISSNINVGHEITDDFFFVVIDIDLPYILDEEREFPTPSFFERCVNTVKKYFKRK